MPTGRAHFITNEAMPEPAPYDKRCLGATAEWFDSLASLP
jgi:hypothetical protein